MLNGVKIRIIRDLGADVGGILNQTFGNNAHEFVSIHSFNLEKRRSF